MASRVLAATSSPYSIAAFAAVGGAIVVWGMINAVTAVGAMNAGLDEAAPAPAPAVVVQPVTAPEPPPPPPPAYVFDAPLPGHVVNSPFGLRQMPWEENGRLHEGVDIAAPAGAPVHVATDGVILRSGVSSTYGRFVEVGHKDGFHTFYAHLGRDAGFKRGAFVRRGTTVAYVGNSGRSTGSHLHFELRNKAGKPLNPALFMGKTFAQADDLPLKAAAKVGRKVRMAQVSRWPDSVKAKMAANGEGVVTRVKGGRIRTRINVVDGQGDPTNCFPGPCAQDPWRPRALNLRMGDHADGALRTVQRQARPMDPGRKAQENGSLVSGPKADRTENARSAQIPRVY